MKNSFEFARTLENIGSRPYSYAIYFDEYRRSLMPRFPYSEVYRITDEQIVILAIAHLRRRPGYWRNRQ